jgi:hypothetical protein
MMKVVSKDGGNSSIDEYPVQAFIKINEYPVQAFIKIKLTKEQVKKLLKKKEITIAQFQFIIE